MSGMRVASLSGAVRGLQAPERVLSLLQAATGSLDLHLLQDLIPAALQSHARVHRKTEILTDNE